MDYRTAYQYQRFLHRKRLAEEIPDTLVLLEHPLVYTLPRRTESENLRMPEAFLRQNGAELVATDRGGEVTLHNPGQLVGYLIVQLDPRRRDLHSYLRWIETCLAAACAQFGVASGQREGLTGLWVENRKLASIGIAVKRWVTLHGFALNVNNDLAPFDWIHPCGLKGVRMTSLARESGHAIEWPRLVSVTMEAFGAEEFSVPSLEEFYREERLSPPPDLAPQRRIVGEHPAKECSPL